MGTDEIYLGRRLDKPRILKEWEEMGLHCVVVTLGTHPCCYIGVPGDSPAVGFSYDDVTVSCHGGLTFSGSLEGFRDGYYYYGWDYAHGGDYTDYSIMIPGFSRFSQGVKYSVDDLAKDIKDVVEDLAQRGC